MDDILSKKCDVKECNEYANHSKFQYGIKTYFCCYHHVLDGGAPASWHFRCLRTYHETHDIKKM